jgi:hypothetical protein
VLDRDDAASTEAGFTLAIPEIEKSEALDATILDVRDCGNVVLCGNTGREPRRAAELLSAAMTAGGAAASPYMEYYRAVHGQDLADPVCGALISQQHCQFQTSLNSIDLLVEVFAVTRADGSRYSQFYATTYPPRELPTGVADPLFPEIADAKTKQIARLIARTDLPVELQSVPLDWDCGGTRCAHSAMRPEAAMPYARAYLRQLGGEHYVTTCGGEGQQSDCRVGATVMGRYVEVDLMTNNIETQHGTRPYGSTVYVVLSAPSV